MNCPYCGKDVGNSRYWFWSCWDCGVYLDNKKDMSVKKFDKDGNYFWNKVPMGYLLVRHEVDV